MTRLASILGVATVATLVLLSGCEQAVTTDYAKDLQGTWSTEFDRMIPLDTAMPMDLTAVTTAVAAEVTRTGTNKGTVSLTIADTLTAAVAPVATTEVMGTIEVTSSKITVTVTGIAVTRGGMAVPNAALPEEVQGLAASPQEMTWNLSGDMLTIGSPLLPVLLADPTTMEFVFTKEPASAATR